MTHNECFNTNKLTSKSSYLKTWHTVNDWLKDDPVTVIWWINFHFLKDGTFRCCSIPVSIFILFFLRSDMSSLVLRFSTFLTFKAQIAQFPVIVKYKDWTEKWQEKTAKNQIIIKKKSGYEQCVIWSIDQELFKLFFFLNLFKRLQKMYDSFIVIKKQGVVLNCFTIHKFMKLNIDLKQHPSNNMSLLTPHCHSVFILFCLQSIPVQPRCWEMLGRWTSSLS